MTAPARRARLAAARWRARWVRGGADDDWSLPRAVRGMAAVDAVHPHEPHRPE